MRNKIAVVILAAGQGKRLGGSTQKVVRNILGKPMLLYLLDTIEHISPERIILIVGYKKEEIFKQLKGRMVEYAEQSSPKGTGDAVLSARNAFKEYNGNILILCGDIPFITAGTLEKLVECHEKNGNHGTILTAFLDNPHGYGRIKRNGNGNVAAIVEELNATEAEKKITEVNSGIYMFRREDLFSALERVIPDKVKGEYYLTDVIEILAEQGGIIGTYTTGNPEECIGVNNMTDMQKARRFLMKRR